MKLKRKFSITYIDRPGPRWIISNGIKYLEVEVYDFDVAKWFCDIMNKKLKPKRKLSHPWRNDVIGNHCSNKANRKKALAEVKRRAKELEKTVCSV